MEQKTDQGRSPVRRAKHFIRAVQSRDLSTAGFLELAQNLSNTGTRTDLTYATVKIAELLEVKDGVVAERVRELRDCGIVPIRALTCWDILCLVGRPEDRDWFLTELWR